MCILFFQLNDSPGETGYRLILASNRDEFWVRPTQLTTWQGTGHQQWIGGVDMEPGREGGTWLGMTNTGKLAVLLNILAVQKPGKKGRGSLVTDYLTSDVPVDEYLERIAADVHGYNTFQLFLIDLSSHTQPVRYICNSEEDEGFSASGNNGSPRAVPRTLPPGIHSSDNSCAHTPWQKRKAGQDRFADIVASYGNTSKKEKLISSILDLLTDKTQYYPDAQLLKQFEEVKFDTGDRIQQRSAMFVWSPAIKYGTRTSTVILVDSHGNCEYIEHSLVTPVDVTDPKWTTSKHTFKLHDKSLL